MRTITIILQLDKLQLILNPELELTGFFLSLLYSGIIADIEYGISL